MFRYLLSSLVLLFFVSNPAQTKEIDAYIFGNSLVHHLSDSDETTVPHWVNFLAKSADHRFAVDGQWGFLRNFSEDLPPRSVWSFKQVQGVWGPDHGAFSKAGFDAVMINSANFIQDRPANQPTAWENPTGRTPVQDTLVVFDWIAAHSSPPKFFIYEGWQEMPGMIESGAPASEFVQYYDNAQNGYHEWYVNWANSVRKERPQYDVQLIPVAKHLAKLFTDTELSKIPPSELYVDDAPHGTATLYFLAAAVTYSAFYDEPIPTNIELPDSIHPLVQQNLDVINQVINGKVQEAKQVEQEEVLPTIQAEVTDAVGLKNPPLAMGLNGMADWSTQNPFVDIMKTARPWVGHLPEEWGAWSAEDLSEGGYLDAAGWPTKIPEKLTAVETFLLTDQPKDSKSISGIYRLQYDGQGQISIGGQAQLVRSLPGEMWFRYQPGEGLIGLAITKTDPNKTGDYIRNIRIVHENQIELFEVGALFNPNWLHHVQDLRVVRYMDWMNTNSSTLSKWDERPKLDDYTYVRRGVPIEAMIKLANRISADPWFTMPHLADDDYMRQFATYVRDNLAVGLIAYVEYSNELWNFTFSQAHWTAKMANERWGQDAAPDAWLQYAGLRAAEMSQIWSEVFGIEAEQRLKRVIATHTGWAGLEEGLLWSPLYMAEDKRNIEPISWFDAYAVTGYFGIELGMDEMAPTVLKWIEASRAKATAKGKEQGLARVSLREFVKEHGFETAVPLAADAIITGSLDELLTVLIPYHAKLAKENGLELVMYEGGTHAAGMAAWSGDDNLRAFFNYLNYSPEMASIYRELLSGWKKAGGTLFNAFVDVSAPSQYGSWGTLRHLDDQNLRHDVLMDFNKNTPAWWGQRAADAFTHGSYLQGTDAGDEMRGTGKGDVMLGKAGNDRFYAKGLGDLIHGGEGSDTVMFPSSQKDYEIRRKSGILYVQNQSVSAQVFAVESFVFADNPDDVIATKTFK